MIKVDCLETKYRFTEAGLAYYETEYRNVIEPHGYGLADTFFKEIFQRVKDEDVPEFLKQIQKTLYCRVFNFLSDVEHLALDMIRKNRKLPKEDQTHLLTIGLLPCFKCEMYNVLEVTSNKLYVEDES
jgi:hypothetical protein